MYRSFAPAVRSWLAAHGRSDAGLALAYLAAYVALDWVSFIYPVLGTSITPWNPAAALALALLLVRGLKWVGLVALGVALAELAVRGVPRSPGFLALLATVLAAGYALAAWVLRGPLGFDRSIPDRGHLLRLIAVLVAAPLLVGALYTGLLVLGGRASGEAAHDAILRYWVGDLVGALVALPLILTLVDDGRRGALLDSLRGRTYPLALLATLALEAAILSGILGNPYKIFYLLFVPVVGIAAWHGLCGAALALGLVQAGLIIGIEAAGVPEVGIIEFQMLLATLALTGLVLGVTVDERAREARRLEESLRLAAAGEMAAALAHELNQPLAALASYARACELLLERDPGSDHRLGDAVRRMLPEARRASAVVARLRDFFRSGAVRFESTDVASLLSAAADATRVEAKAAGVAIEVEVEPGLPAVQVDRVQIGVVLRNLIANAIEASAGSASPTVRVEAHRHGEDLRLSFVDSGPGVPASEAGRLFEAFYTTKGSGMGLGLAISRAIVEAHGGRLVVEPATQGRFHLTIPGARAAEPAAGHDVVASASAAISKST